LFHEVEASVALQKSVPLEPLSLFVLRALALRQEQSPLELKARLDLDVSLIVQVLKSQATAGLSTRNLDSLWSISPPGLEAVEHGTHTRKLAERRTFCFLDIQETGRSPRFTSLRRLPAGMSANSSGNPEFDPGILHDCIHRPVDWKQRRAFPQDMTEILMNEEGMGASFERILIDRPRRVLFALALTGEGPEERIRAFEIKPEGWTLEWRDPFLTMGPEWRREMPELVPEPSLEEWRRALLEWCRERRIPTVDFTACPLERQSCRLLLKAPPGKMPPSRWREMFKEKPWLFAGSGSIRSLATITIANS
jgi:hypothetical protein